MRILSLFDYTGIMVKPWTEAGHETIIVDIQHESEVHENATRSLNWSVSEAKDKLIALKPDIIFAFPPCTDLAASGARHFEAKAAIDPDFQIKAVKLAKVTYEIGEELQVPWFVENPVGKLSTLWRKPNFYFNPYEYGGYLPENDIHPSYPEYIPPRDAYTKKTGIWHNDLFVVPPRKTVYVPPGYSTQYSKLGGKSLKTKNIRSATPRGWAQAVFEANSKN